MIADRIADAWEQADPWGILALQIIEGRPIDRDARAILPPGIMAALVDPVAKRELRREFFGEEAAPRQPVRVSARPRPRNRGIEAAGNSEVDGERRYTDLVVWIAARVISAGDSAPARIAAPSMS